MPVKNKYCIVVTTFSKESTGKKIIDSLLAKRLAACAQVQNIKSYYHWKGRVNSAAEKLLFIKTKKSLYKNVKKDMISNHDYETPEIIMIPINSGFEKYLQWIDKECK